jgi:heme/copper-type cytochrome/quinol oxidase subunit 2
MLVRGGDTRDIPVRATALVIAVLLAVPACIALLRPRGTGADEPRRRLDALWAVVPAALLAVLGAFAIAA